MDDYVEVSGSSGGDGWRERPERGSVDSPVEDLRGRGAVELPSVLREEGVLGSDHLQRDDKSIADARRDLGEVVGDSERGIKAVDREGEEQKGGRVGEIKRTKEGERRVEEIRETFYRPTQEAIARLVIEEMGDVPELVEGPMIDWLYRYWYMEPGPEYKGYYKIFLNDNSPLMRAVGLHGYIAQKAIEASVYGVEVDEEDLRKKIEECAGRFETVEKALEIQRGRIRAGETENELVVIGKVKGGRGGFDVRATEENVDRAKNEKEVLQRLAKYGVSHLVGFFRKYASLGGERRSSIQDSEQGLFLDYESLPSVIRNTGIVRGEVLGEGGPEVIDTEPGDSGAGEQVGEGGEDRSRREGGDEEETVDEGKHKVGDGGNPSETREESEERGGDGAAREKMEWLMKEPKSYDNISAMADLAIKHPELRDKIYGEYFTLEMEGMDS
ncbi:hypothetical protein C4577_06745 [Candidatus Parcubacteria bacterium]|nr:MAG: hypothetical protein C4577_06745 [Candidatus Parcubacteria bacterium]